MKRQSSSMINVQHLVDRTSDTRGASAFSTLTAAAGDGFCHSQLSVNARVPLPPGTYGDIVVLHCNPSWSRLPFMFLLREDCGDKPLIIIERTYSKEFERRCVANRNRFHSLLRTAYRLADVVIASSSAQGEWLLRNQLVSEDKVAILSLPVDLATFRVVEPVKRTSRPLSLLAGGRFHRQYGFDVLIEAMKQLPSGFATLEVLGFGDDRELLIDASRRTSGVRISTDTDLWSSRLPTCDAVIVPSRWQPVQLEATEAQAVARPLIVTNADDYENIGLTAWGECVPVESPSALAEAIIRLPARPLADLGRAGRAAAVVAMAQSKSTWSSILHRLSA